MRHAAILGSIGLLLTFGACGSEPSTPLAKAAAVGDLEQVQDLLKKGASPDGVEGRGFTPLACAARNEHTEILSLLLKAGADPDRRDSGGNGWTPLIHAIHKNQIEAVRILFEGGADVNAAVGGGATPLIFAAAYGNAEMVRELLARGADPHAEARGGVSALSNAAGGGALFDFTDGPPLGTCHLDTVKALLEKAPDLKLKKSFWTRSASVFARSKECKAVEALVRPAASSD